MVDTELILLPVSLLYVIIGSLGDVIRYEEIISDQKIPYELIGRRGFDRVYDSDAVAYDEIRGNSRRAPAFRFSDEEPDLNQQPPGPAIQERQQLPQEQPESSEDGSTTPKPFGGRLVSFLRRMFGNKRKWLGVKGDTWSADIQFQKHNASQLHDNNMQSRRSAHPNIRLGERGLFNSVPDFQSPVLGQPVLLPYPYISPSHVDTFGPTEPHLLSRARLIIPE